tara:strand:- start:1196 stop:1702 length:507 start_codon:yes stop_codon:yes gene_type:complete
MKVNGNVFRFEDNIDTDIIIPARYCSSYQKEDLTPHCMEGHPEWTDGSFATEVQDGDIIVAGDNFGCGSSREVAPLCIKWSGVSLVIANSFARIFYRNSINIGLPILVCKEVVEITEHKDKIKANLRTGEIVNITKNKTFQAEPFPKFIEEIIKSGGLINWIKQQGLT